MTSVRHRFIGNVGELCKEKFGGVAACALGYGASLHYSDQDHPYTERPAGPKGECGWALQNANPNDRATHCGADKDDAAHDLVSSEPETEVLDLGPGPVAPDWRSAVIGMPDVAAEAQGRGPINPEGKLGPDYTPQWEKRPGTLADLEQEAKSYAWEAAKFAVGPGEEMRLLEEAGPQQPWQKAIRVLEGIDGELLHGPWPVRRFKIPDSLGVNQALEDVREALGVLEVDYTEQMWRPAGEDYRLCLMTWDWANGIGTEAICDELASFYDQS